jgi:hypothetical protein
MRRVRMAKLRNYEPRLLSEGFPLNVYCTIRNVSKIFIFPLRPKAILCTGCIVYLGFIVLQNMENSQFEFFRAIRISSIYPSCVCMYVLHSMHFYRSISMELTFY